MLFHASFNVFIAIIETKSFTAAAKKIGISGAAVGKHVQNLEQKLKLRLFQRTTRTIVPTEAAMKLYDVVSSSQDYFNEVVEQLSREQDTPSGRLRLNVPMSYGEQYLAKPLAAFAARYPDVIVDVDFDDKRVHLIEEGYDLVVRIGVLEDSGLIAKRISDFPIMLCASPQFLQKYAPPHHPRDLQSWPFICYSNAPNPASWTYTDAQGQLATQSFSPALFANSAAMLKEACLAGVGAALLPYFSCKAEIDSKKLVHILPEFTNAPQRGVYVIYPEKQFIPLKVRTFIDVLSAHSFAP